MEPPMLLPLLLASSAAAFPADVVAPVREYVRANATQTAKPLERAFHPTALMYWVGPDGDVLIRTMAEWRKLIAEGAHKARFEQTIVALDRSGDAAVATVAGSRDGKPLTDYLLLMKLQGEWKIVGKVFSSTPHPAKADAATDAELRAVVQAKLRSDLSFNGDELLRTQQPRAMFFNLDMEQLVAVSAQEWAARFDRRRKEGSTLKPLSQKIDAVAATGDVGYARWTVDWSSGNRIVDYALLIRQNGQWRMVNTAWVRHDGR
jgi:hypothetical protein